MARERKAPRAEQYAFTRVSLGTWIDGAYGMEHAVNTMAGSLLPTVARRSSDEDLKKSAQALIDEQDEGLEEEDWDEYLDDATEVLEGATTPGLSWEWEAGDLVLTDEDDDEDEDEDAGEGDEDEEEEA